MRTDFCRSEIGAPPRSTPSAGRWARQRRLRSPPALLQQLLLLAMLATNVCMDEELGLQERSEKPLSELMVAAGSLRATMHGYHHFYETALARFRHVPGLRLLEIGVNQGESLLLWLQYFSSLAPDGVQGL